MGWTKFFGHQQPLREPESWSRTPLDNMTGVELVHNDKVIAIHGPGEYWQSDSFRAEVVLAGAPPVQLTHRRIEKLMAKPELAKIAQDPFGLAFDFRESIIYPEPSEDTSYIYNPQPQDLPYWLVLEIDVLNDRLRFYHSKERI